MVINLPIPNVSQALAFDDDWAGVFITLEDAKFYKENIFDLIDKSKILQENVNNLSTLLSSCNNSEDFSIMRLTTHQKERFETGNVIFSNGYGIFIRGDNAITISFYLNNLCPKGLETGQFEFDIYVEILKKFGRLFN